MNICTLFVRLSGHIQRMMLVITSTLFTLLACTTPSEPPPAKGTAAIQASGEPPASEGATGAREEAGALQEIVVSARKSQANPSSRQLAAVSGMAQPHYDMAFSQGHPPPGIRWPADPVDRENYVHFDSNPTRRVTEHPVSTFSIDVDTGSYANVRRMLNDGVLPPQDAVRIEELINYFSYDYALPGNQETPFSINMEVAATPWNPQTHLLQVGLKGFETERTERPATNLVFLIDISGSMNSADKLPLLKNAFRLLTKQLNSDDSVALVVYAGGTGIALEPTPGNQKARIMSAIEQLSANGSTNGAAGIRLAYQMAEQAYIEDGINRVILATDGDFNVGTVDFDSLIDLIEDKRANGVSLTTLGFGSGNYNDHLMEQLADKGNGNYAYIDSLKEARKVLVEEMSSTLQTIAKDVKIQIEFNPSVVAEYRLIGYENRTLRREDFNNDKIDAGEIGAGHTVTALYEVSLQNSKGQRIDPLRYSSAETPPQSDGISDELAFVRLRYKQPESDTSQLIEQAVLVADSATLTDASTEMQFAAAVAAFGQKLRGGVYLEDFGYEDIRQLAGSGRGKDRYGYRGEFLGLVGLAESLSTEDRDRIAAR